MTKANRLFVVLAGFFITNALLAEFIGVKIFSLEKTLGLPPANLTLIGVESLSFNLTAGVLLWPVVFVLTDLINEYYGRQGVRLLSFLAAGLIGYAFVMVSGAMATAPADFWVTRQTDAGPIDMPRAFNTVFGQGLWIIVGSLVAFLVGQLLDVAAFYALKRLTGERWLWVRATGSTLISQFVDSFVVLFIAFYIGAGWELRTVLSVGLMNYAYKFAVAVALTPLLYVVHGMIDRYLGADQAREMVAQATAESTGKWL